MSVLRGRPNVIYKVLCLLLLVVSLGLMMKLHSQSRELAAFRATPHVALNCQGADPLVRLWCQAGVELPKGVKLPKGDEGPKGERHQAEFREGWLSALYQLLSEEPSLGDNTKHSVAWQAGAKALSDHIETLWGRTFDGIYTSQAFRSINDKLAADYTDHVAPSDQDALSKQQYVLGYLTGYLYGLQLPHQLDQLSNAKEIKQYSTRLAQEYIKQEKLNHLFNLGFQDGVNESVLALSQKLSGALSFSHQTG